MKLISAIHSFKLWKSIHKVHFFLLLAGFLILILQITYGFLVERQLYFEPDPWLKIPLPDIDNNQDLTWNWESPKRKPWFGIVFFINLFPVLFTLCTSLEFWNLHINKRSIKLRVFLFLNGFITLALMALNLSNSLEPPGYSWYQKIIGGDSWQMQSLKIIERNLYISFTCWTILVLGIFVIRYIRKKNSNEKPPVPTTL